MGQTLLPRVHTVRTKRCGVWGSGSRDYLTVAPSIRKWTQSDRQADRQLTTITRPAHARQGLELQNRGSIMYQLMTNMIRVQLWSYFFNCMCSWLQHLLPNMHSSFRRATYVGLRTFVSYKHCLHDNWIKLNVLPIVLVIRIISVYQLHWSCSYLLHVHISRWLCQR